MGNDNSKELLAVPLLPQPKPVRLSSYSTITTVPTMLRVKIPTWRSTIQVFHGETSELLFEIKSPTMSTRTTIHTPDGAAVVSAKKKTFQSNYRVYEGSETDKESFSITVKKAMFGPLIVLAEFEDQVSGGLCRVLVEGDSSENVSIIYLERGSPDLSLLLKRENATQPQYQAIGRIHRQNQRKEEFVEAAAGVDLTLMLVLWLVRYNIDNTKRAVAAGQAGQVAG